MDKILKRLSIPTTLLLVVSIWRIVNLFQSLGGLFSGYFNIASLLSMAISLSPVVLLCMLLLKPDDKNMLGITAIAIGGAELLSMLLNLGSIRLSDGILVLFQILLNGIVMPLLIGGFFLTFGLKLLNNEEIPVFGDSFCLMQICSLLYIGVACVVFIIATVSDIFTGLMSFGGVFYAISLWYIPKLYSEKERKQTEISVSTAIKFVIGVAIVWAVLWLVNNIANSPSSRTDEPWRELGVTKKEYMDVYNYYKYGEWVG